MKRYLEFTDGRKCEISNIYAIASNYRNHAIEMGSFIPEKPLVFLKPTSSYVPDGETIWLPPISKNIQYEVELVVVIGKDGFNIPENEAFDYIGGYAVGIDVTLRDLQKEAKNEGKPWGIAKGFYSSAPISKVVPSENFLGNIPDFDLVLKVNGELRQTGNTKDMERSVARLVSFISKVFSLNEGDCIFTGTPEGVGSISDGDYLEAELKNYVKLVVFAKKLEINMEFL
ncbi:MAG: fumarylacetoacetate hydrolase family protein [Candidatus Kapaibacteriales bacterium]